MHSDPGDENDHKPLKRIFVYGSLRKSEYNHRGDFAKNAIPVATGIIRGADLVSLGVYPAIIPGKGTVKGEVYDLPTHTFDWIEAMELGAGYERLPVKVEATITGPEHDIDTEVDAEAYFYADPKRLANLPRVASGDWVKRDPSQIVGDEVV